MQSCNFATFTPYKSIIRYNHTTQLDWVGARIRFYTTTQLRWVRPSERGKTRIDGFCFVWQQQSNRLTNTIQSVRVEVVVVVTSKTILFMHKCTHTQCMRSPGATRPSAQTIMHKCTHTHPPALQNSFRSPVPRTTPLSFEDSRPMVPPVLLNVVTVRVRVRATTAKLFTMHPLSQSHFLFFFKPHSPFSRPFYIVSLALSTLCEHRDGYE